MIMSRAPGNIVACAKLLHEPPEFREARRDHLRVVNGDRAFRREPHGQKRHGDAVIEMCLDRTAA